MKAQYIREAFLDFFSKKDHKIVKSSSLLPKDDPTLLFTNAGMNQFKNIFLGLEQRSYKRAASVQKCLRVSGKHNDLEQVGMTNKHHTFFEMLGNFSFGDYFKEKAIELAWELVTEVFKLEQDKLYITIYEEDEEAFRFWNEKIGIPQERIFRFGKEENFWAMGDVGPCGPCSEIHYDLNEGLEAGTPFSLIEKGSDRFIELWNLVFMQFYQDEKRNLHPLPSPSIDTGMGLERAAAALQKKKSNYDTDLFILLVEAICDLTRREYPSHDSGDISVRIIADHLRAITFLINDGIMPSNDGRGYVLRRLIRRAFRHGNLLGIDKPFLYKFIGKVSEIMKDAYPELLTSSAFVSSICLSEEERFSATLSSGMRYFEQFVEETEKAGERVLSGAKIFKLYDTFGFPLDFSLELAKERNLEVDEQGFYSQLEEQRLRARQSWKGDLQQREKKAYEKLKDLAVESLCYETDELSEAEVLAIIKEGEESAELGQGESGEIVLSKTPFYAEAGGQVGDTGIIKGSFFSARVENAYYPIPELISHKVKIISGKLQKGDRVEAKVDLRRRMAISNNHTATHLLHASLRQVLGDHVKQSGSLVSPSRLRFDFTHYSPLSKEEIEKVENLVNEKIREDIAVRTRITTLEEGLKEGAMAIFEEKYGEKVRMVVIDEFSKELCGGVHVASTGQIGLFKIISEENIAAGMRRIEALTGEEAVRYVQESERLLNEVQRALNSSRKDILAQLEKLRETLKELEKENKSLRQKLLSQRFEGEGYEKKVILGVPVVAKKVEAASAEELRSLADSLRQKLGQGIVILASTEKNKVFLIVAVTKDLVHRVKANEVVREVSLLIGGGGGGRPDFAQAGGTKPESVGQAFERSFFLIEKMLGSKA